MQTSHSFTAFGIQLHFRMIALTQAGACTSFASTKLRYTTLAANPQRTQQGEARDVASTSALTRRGCSDRRVRT